MEALAAMFSAVLFAGAPLILAAVGETVAERTGVVNLSLDGAILLSAMAAFAMARLTGDPFAGLFFGGLCGAGVAGLLALLGLVLGAPLLATGFVLTLFCRDLAYFLGHAQARQPGPDLGLWTVPGLADLPFLGTAVGRASPAVYLALAAVVAAWWFLYRTRTGLTFRAVGESGQAAGARGISVLSARVWATLACGFLAGLAGGAYSLSVKPGWGHPQGAEGAGWIALAIVIFGGWRPFRVALGALFFALIQVAGIHLQDALPGLSNTIFQVAPFPVMIVTLLLVNVRRSARFRDALRGAPLLGRLASRPVPGAPGALGRILDQGMGDGR